MLYHSCISSTPIFFWFILLISAAEMTYIGSSKALNSTHSLWLIWTFHYATATHNPHPHLSV